MEAENLEHGQSGKLSKVFTATDTIAKTVIVLLIGLIVGVAADRQTKLVYQDVIDTCLATKAPSPPLPHSRPKITHQRPSLGD